MTFLVQTTVYLTVTAALVLLFKFIFKNKLPAKWHVLIWAVLLIRFFVPSLPQSEYSVFNAVTLPTYFAETETNTQINNEIKIDTESVATDEAIYAEEVTGTSSGEKVILAVWCAGVGALLLYFALVYCVCVRKSKKIAKVDDDETLQMLDECKKSVGTKRKVTVLCGGESPMLLGLFRPKILLPDGYGKSEQRYILTHELCHLKNHDILVIWLAILILAFNWFNPIIWYSFFTLRRDIEVYCDERVLKHCEGKKEYATLLLKSALAKNRFIAGTTSLQNGEKEVERRIKYLAFFKKPRAILSIVIAAAAVVISVLCLTNALPRGNVYHADSFTFSAPTGKVTTLNGTQITALDMRLALEDAKIGIVELASSQNMDKYNFVPETKDKTAVYGYNKTIYKQTVSCDDGNELTVYCIEYPTEEADEGDTMAVVFFKSGAFSGVEINQMLKSFEFDVSELYIKAAQYLQEEVYRVFSPYYETLNVEISHWEESGNTATFYFSVINKNYDKDPDTVGYIKEAKENGNANYEYMKEDYLAPKEMNFGEMKIILDGDTFYLYRNSSVYEDVWLPFEFDNCIL